ncbi:hypothetical protein JXA32_00870 [Candidatus Sumerlaeota bacterium]|nr:hypothetical protein [Candidatus Sumerlaeota bacterium]
MHDFFGQDLLPFFHEGQPREENSAAYYVEAFDLYTSATSGLSASILNDPTQLDAMPAIQDALDRIEAGADCGPCDFSGLYDFSLSGYFHERPDSIEIRMLAYLLFQRTVRELKLRHFEPALRHAHHGVIFGAHLYISAETHTQASMALEILAAACGQTRNVERELGSSFKAHDMDLLMRHYREIMEQHVRLAPPIRSTAHYDYELTLQNLLNPLAVVRMEGLRMLGNVIDPRVNPEHIVSPSYRELRIHVSNDREKILRLLENIAKDDPEPRVRQLAAQLKQTLEERKTFEPLIEKQDEPAEPESIETLMRELEELKKQTGRQ